MDADNIVSFQASRLREGREPPLTDSELAQLRRLLRQNACVVSECPVARHILESVED